MHLEGPWLSTTGKKKGKKKFRNADAARTAQHDKEAWAALLDKHGVTKASTKKEKPTLKPLTYKPTFRGAEAPKIPSKGDGVGIAAAKPTQVYTGTKMIGIGQLHKSNAVPVFSEEEAVAISRMRR